MIDGNAYHSLAHVESEGVHVFQLEIVSVGMIVIKNIKKYPPMFFQGRNVQVSRNSFVTVVLNMFFV